MKEQKLLSVEADFEKMTWTFGIGETSEVGAGEYAILPYEDFGKMKFKLGVAEKLLRKVLDYPVMRDGLAAELQEHISSYFDPEPL